MLPAETSLDVCWQSKKLKTDPSTRNPEDQHKPHQGLVPPTYAGFPAVLSMEFVARKLPSWKRHLALNPKPTKVNSGR